MASQINASNSGFGGIVSTGDSSGELQLQTTGTTAVTINTSQNVGIGTASPTAKFQVAGTGTSTSFRGNINAIFGSNGSGYDSTIRLTDAVANSTDISLKGNTVALSVNGVFPIYYNDAGNVGINNSNPGQFDTSGEVLNISGAAANTNPSVLFMAGNGGGAGYEATEVFAIAGITAATEITRNTGTGANGFRAYLKVTVTGHSGGVGNGINIKEFYWDGGTGAPVQISTYTNGSVPVISFDNTTSNVWIVKLASSNGTASFNGVMKVEWLMPVDFASSTWTIS